MNPDIARFARTIHRLRRDVRSMARASQAAHRSVEIAEGPVAFYGEDGEPRLLIGAADDGTFTVVENNPTPPPRPTEPDILTVPGGYQVIWDGTYEDGNTPVDYQRCEVHAGDVPGYEKTDATQVATFTSPDGGSVFIPRDAELDPVWVALVAVNRSNLESAASVEVDAVGGAFPGPTAIEPTVSPAPLIIGGISVLHVVFPPTDGTNTEVEVHISTSPFVPVAGDPATLVQTVTGTGTTIDTMPNGDPIVAAVDLDGDPATPMSMVTYYVGLIAKNSAGTAAPSAVASGTLRQVTTPDVNAEAAWVGTMTADRLRAGKIDVTLDLRAGGEISATGAGGQKVAISGAFGFTVDGANVDNNPRYIWFPTDGKPNIISGTLQASTLSVSGDPITGQAATFRGNSQLEVGATLTLNNSVAAPLAAPAAQASGWEHAHNNLAYAISNGGGIWSAPAYDHANAYLYTCTTYMNYSDWVNDVYRIERDTGNNTKRYKISFPGSTTAQVKGMTLIGGTLYVLWRRTNSTWSIARHNLSTGAYIDRIDLTYNVADATIGTDGTSPWVAHTSGGNVRFQRFPADMSSAVAAETVATTDAFAGGSAGGNYYRSLIVGAFDFGARKFVLGMQVAGSLVCRVYDTAGAREPNNEFLLMEQNDSIIDINSAIPGGFLFWNAADHNTASGYFMGMARYVSAPKIYRYTGIKLASAFQTWYAGYTFYRSSDNKESASSPQQSFLMYSRWRYMVTISQPPSGTVGRVYIGTASGPSNSKLEATLGTGVVAVTRTSYSGAGAAPPATSTFTAGEPSTIRSEATITRTITASITNGSKAITSGGGVNAFKFHHVGKAISGTGIPAGAKIESVTSDTAATLSVAATATNAAVAVTLTLPKLEIRGDGFARIAELERVIINSTVDANNSAGNEPALRVGDINGLHLRIDNNEIIAMSDDVTQSGLLLNVGHRVRFGGKTWKTGQANAPAPGTGGGVSSVNVSWSGDPFVDPPIVMLQATTGVAGPGTEVFVWPSAITANGFTVNASRSTNNATTVRWFAIDV